MSQAEDLSAFRRLSAATIKPGWAAQDLATWCPLKHKPTLKDLKMEVLRRAACHEHITPPHPSNWTGVKLVQWLAEVSPPAAESQDAAELECLLALEPALVAVDAGDSDTTARWSAHRMLPLLVNCILYLKDDFLERDGSAPSP
jgi:hypothetical protein